MLKLQIAILATVAMLAAASAPAQTLYKCKDSKGKTYYTQTPPTECLGKEMDELSKQGRVVKKREAAMTPEQMAAREAEEKRKKDEEERAKEERRKNQALLNTYSSEKDIEDGRQRALKQSEQAAKDIEKRIAETQKRAQVLAVDPTDGSFLIHDLVEKIKLILPVFALIGLPMDALEQMLLAARHSFGIRNSEPR